MSARITDSGCVPCPVCGADLHADCVGGVVHVERTHAAVRLSSREPTDEQRAEFMRRVQEMSKTHVLVLPRGAL